MGSGQGLSQQARQPEQSSLLRLQGLEEKKSGEVVRHSFTYNLKNEPVDDQDDDSSFKSDASGGGDRLALPKPKTESLGFQRAVTIGITKLEPIETGGRPRVSQQFMDEFSHLLPPPSQGLDNLSVNTKSKSVKLMPLEASAYFGKQKPDHKSSPPKEPLAPKEQEAEKPPLNDSRFLRSSIDSLKPRQSANYPRLSIDENRQSSCYDEPELKASLAEREPSKTSHGPRSSGHKEPLYNVTSSLHKGAESVGSEQKYKKDWPKSSLQSGRSDQIMSDHQLEPTPKETSYPPNKIIMFEQQESEQNNSALGQQVQQPLGGITGGGNISMSTDNQNGGHSSLGQGIQYKTTSDNFYGQQMTGIGPYIPKSNTGSDHNSFKLGGRSSGFQVYEGQVNQEEAYQHDPNQFYPKIDHSLHQTIPERPTEPNIESSSKLWQQEKNDETTVGYLPPHIHNQSQHQESEQVTYSRVHTTEEEDKASQLPLQYPKSHLLPTHLLRFKEKNQRNKSNQNTYTGLQRSVDSTQKNLRDQLEQIAEQKVQQSESFELQSSQPTSYLRSQAPPLNNKSSLDPSNFHMMCSLRSPVAAAPSGASQGTHTPERDLTTAAIQRSGKELVKRTSALIKYPPLAHSYKQFANVDKRSFDLKYRTQANSSQVATEGDVNADTAHLSGRLRSSGERPLDRSQSDDSDDRKKKSRMKMIIGKLFKKATGVELSKYRKAQEYRENIHEQESRGRRRDRSHRDYASSPRSGSYHSLRAKNLSRSDEGRSTSLTQQPVTAHLRQKFNASKQELPAAGSEDRSSFVQTYSNSKASQSTNTKRSKINRYKSIERAIQEEKQTSVYLEMIREREEWETQQLREERERLQEENRRREEAIRMAEARASQERMAYKEEERRHQLIEETIRMMDKFEKDHPNLEMTGRLRLQDNELTIQREFLSSRNDHPFPQKPSEPMNNLRLKDSIGSVEDDRRRMDPTHRIHGNQSNFTLGAGTHAHQNSAHDSSAALPPVRQFYSNSSVQSIPHTEPESKRDTFVDTLRGCQPFAQAPSSAITPDFVVTSERRELFPRSMAAESQGNLISLQPVRPADNSGHQDITPDQSFQRGHEVMPSSIHNRRSEKEGRRFSQDRACYERPCPEPMMRHPEQAYHSQEREDPYPSRGREPDYIERNRQLRSQYSGASGQPSNRPVPEERSYSPHEPFQTLRQERSVQEPFQDPNTFVSLNVERQISRRDEVSPPAVLSGMKLQSDFGRRQVHRDELLSLSNEDGQSNHVLSGQKPVFMQPQQVPIVPQQNYDAPPSQPPLPPPSAQSYGHPHAPPQIHQQQLPPQAPPQPQLHQEPTRLRTKKTHDATPPLHIVDRYEAFPQQVPPPGYQRNLEVYRVETPIINVSVEQDQPVRKTKSVKADKHSQNRKKVKEAQQEVRAAIQKVEASIARSQSRKSSKLRQRSSKGARDFMNGTEATTDPRNGPSVSSSRQFVEVYPPHKVTEFNQSNLEDRDTDENEQSTFNGSATNLLPVKQSKRGVDPADHFQKVQRMEREYKKQVKKRSEGSKPQKVDLKKLIELQVQQAQMLMDLQQQYLNSSKHPHPSTDDSRSSKLLGSGPLTRSQVSKQASVQTSPITQSSTSQTAADLIQAIYRQMEKINRQISKKEEIDVDRFHRMEAKMKKLYQRYAAVKSTDNGFDLVSSTSGRAKGRCESALSGTKSQKQKVFKSPHTPHSKEGLPNKRSSSAMMSDNDKKLSCTPPVTKVALKSTKREPSPIDLKEMMNVSIQFDGVSEDKTGDFNQQFPSLHQSPFGQSELVKNLRHFSAQFPSVNSFQHSSQSSLKEASSNKELMGLFNQLIVSATFQNQCQAKILEVLKAQGVKWAEKPGEAPPEFFQLLNQASSINSPAPLQTESQKLSGAQTSGVTSQTQMKEAGMLGSKISTIDQVNMNEEAVQIQQDRQLTSGTLSHVGVETKLNTSKHDIYKDVSTSPTVPAQLTDKQIFTHPFSSHAEIEPTSQAFSDQAQQDRIAQVSQRISHQNISLNTSPFQGSRQIDPSTAKRSQVPYYTSYLNQVRPPVIYDYTQYLKDRASLPQQHHQNQFSSSYSSINRLEQEPPLMVGSMSSQQTVGHQVKHAYYPQAQGALQGMPQSQGVLCPQGGPSSLYVNTLDHQAEQQQQDFPRVVSGSLTFIKEEKICTSYQDGGGSMENPTHYSRTLDHRQDETIFNQPVVVDSSHQTSERFPTSHERTMQEQTQDRSQRDYTHPRFAESNPRCSGAPPSNSSTHNNSVTQVTYVQNPQTASQPTKVMGGSQAPSMRANGPYMPEEGQTESFQKNMELPDGFTAQSLSQQPTLQPSAFQGSKQDFFAKSKAQLGEVTDLALGGVTHEQESASPAGAYRVIESNTHPAGVLTEQLADANMRFEMKSHGESLQVSGGDYNNSAY